MALLKFLKGNYSNLSNAAITEGQILICGDTGEMFVDVAADKRVKIGDFITVANLTALEALDATKVPTSRLYYVEDGNILARSNGTSWVQVNKQPTTEELKGLLGLGTLAYKSEVAEADLNADLAAKINASTAANHGHDNKTVLDGITAEKVAAWDAAEGNAKAHANDLDAAMNTRVEALEAVDHTHANKALLDTYTQTEENLADAVAKKHEHANKTELDKIAAGDVAKWNGVVADHLVAADKAALEDTIGDVNTALGEEVTRAKAAEKANADAITAMKNGVAVNDFAGVEAELAKKVDKVTGKSLIADTEITRLAGMSDGANKVEASENNGYIKIDGVETAVYTHPTKHNITDIEGLQEALDGKQGSGDFAAENHKHTKEDITDFAHTHIAAEITDLDATIKAYDYATKTEAQGYADAKDEAIEAAQAAADKAQGEVDALETYVGTFTASEGVDTVVKYIDAKTANIASDDRVDGIEDRVKAIEDDYLVGADKTELADAIAAEKTRAEGIEGGLETRLAAVEADYLKTADKTALQGSIDEVAGNVTAIAADYLKAADKTELVGKINAKADQTALDSVSAVANAAATQTALQGEIDRAKGEEARIEGLVTAEADRAAKAEENLQTQINTIMNNPDTEGVINSINEFTQYIADHGEIAEGFRTGIDANAKAIEDHETLAAQTYETKEDATAKYDELAALVGEKAVQADWAQADDTAADFIKNRPFYEDVIVENVYSGSIDGSTGAAYESFFIVTLSESFVINANDKCTVKYDGKEYSLTPMLYEDGYMLIGDSSSNYPTAEIPFVININTNDYSYAPVIMIMDAEVHTLEIGVCRSEIKTIDEKFIPDIDWEKIKNKPFYEEEITKTLVFEEEFVAENWEYNDYGQYYQYNFDVNNFTDAALNVVYEDKGLNPEEKYVIDWGGQEYTIDSWVYMYDGTTHLKSDNTDLYSETALKDLTFHFTDRFYKNRTFIVQGNDNTPSYVKIYILGGGITHLDDKFISDNIARVADVEAVSTALTQYQEAHAGDYTNAQIDEKVQAVSDVVAALDDTYATDEELATSIEAAKTDASNKDAVVLAEAQAYADQAEADAVAAAEGKVNALAGNVYTKEQTYTQAEVDALLTAAQSWGEF